MRLAITLLALSAGLLVPQVATANSGSITDVHPSLDGTTVYATYTTSFDVCDTNGFCGWYPHAWQVPAAQTCFVDNSHLTYVGDYQDASGTQTGTDYFYPSFNPTRICLYASNGSQEYFIADYVYGPAAPPPVAPAPVAPTPAPTPAPVSRVMAPLTIAEGRSLLSGVLQKRYGRRFARSSLKRACYRLTRAKVRCRVSWRKSPYKYSGRVTMRNDPDDPVNSFVYSVVVNRKRINRRPPLRRQPSQPAPARPPSPPSSSCDPSYSGCLDPNAYDYDCAGGSGDGPRYTGRVRVIGSDHYDLDRDGDGVACDE